MQFYVHYNLQSNHNDVETDVLNSFINKCIYILYIVYTYAYIFIIYRMAMIYIYLVSTIYFCQTLLDCILYSKTATNIAKLKN